MCKSCAVGYRGYRGTLPCVILVQWVIGAIEEPFHV